MHPGENKIEQISPDDQPKLGISDQTDDQPAIAPDLLASSDQQPSFIGRGRVDPVAKTDEFGQAMQLFDASANSRRAR